MATGPFPAPLRVVLATRNEGKAREFERLLGAGFSICPLPGEIEMPAETGSSFAENARLKAEYVFTALGGHVAVLADDSGLEVAALGGKPGVYSARYAGERATDEQNVARLLRELAGIKQREARFVCCLCLVLPAARSDSGFSSEDDSLARQQSTQPRLIEVAGVTRGTITNAPRGDQGFGYDPVFCPLGWQQTLAEASPERKDGVSHRGAAARVLLRRLQHEDEGDSGTQRI